MRPAFLSRAPLALGVVRIGPWSLQGAILASTGAPEPTGTRDWKSSHELLVRFARIDSSIGSPSVGRNCRQIHSRKLHLAIKISGRDFVVRSP
jgi:hypothetical protein